MSAEGGSSLKGQFDKYCRFGNPKKTTMTTSACNKMLREAKVTTGPGSKYSSADVDIAFSKVKQKTQKEINFDEFKKLLDELSKKKGGQTPDEISNKITKVAGPGTQGTTKVARKEVVDHLTDTSKYTGSHKERFDDSGKGKGIDGRKDRPEQSGYVTGYKEKGTFDKKPDEAATEVATE